MSSSKHLNQPHWRDVLPDLRRRLRSDRILVATDFDGTIANLAATPDYARILPEARAALKRLSSHAKVTAAVISGRALEDVAEKVGLPEIIYSGNHGLEMRGPEIAPLALFKDEIGDELKGVMAFIDSELHDVNGVLIENKAASASVHYRLAHPEDHERIAAAAFEGASLSSRLRLNHGKMVWELRPDLGWNKGSAVIRLMDRFKVRAASTFFLGDDETDRDVFRVLPLGATFIVGERAAPRASYRCESPEDASALLTWMADELDRQRAF